MYQTLATASVPEPRRKQSLRRGSIHDRDVQGSIFGSQQRSWPETQHIQSVAPTVAAAEEGSILLRHYDRATLSIYQHRYLTVSSILHVAVSFFRTSKSKGGSEAERAVS